MSDNILDSLATLIQRERESLLSRWREQVRQLPSARNLDTPTLNDHVPTLLDELTFALRSHDNATIPDSLREGSPPAHGMQRAEDGFDIEEVVAEYNILRECIHDLADCNGINLQGRPFQILNRVLDGAIGLAVQTYAAARAIEVRQRREEYLAFVAHDLRTPLNAISLSAKVLEMMLPHQPATAESLSMLKTLQRNATYLDALVRKIIDENANLDAEVGVKLQRRNFDLWPVVESLIRDMLPLAETSNSRVFNRVPLDLVAYADADVLKRILQNLLSNAIKYTPHGEITIEAEQVREDGTVECRVSDNGTGILDEKVSKIFNKGETDENNTDGVGLGLAIVKALTEAHGGFVSVTSKEGLGSTFQISLPGRKTK